MQVIDGIVTIVQESRFQLVDDRGVAHLITLGHGSMAEPEQLQDLVAQQSRVRVRCSEQRNVIGFVAHSVARV